jgi:hypothetical protein
MKGITEIVVAGKKVFLLFRSEITIPIGSAIETIWK